MLHSTYDVTPFCDQFSFWLIEGKTSFSQQLRKTLKPNWETWYEIWTNNNRPKWQVIYHIQPFLASYSVYFYMVSFYSPWQLKLLCFHERTEAALVTWMDIINILRQKLISRNLIMIRNIFRILFTEWQDFYKSIKATTVNI